MGLATVLLLCKILLKMIFNARRRCAFSGLWVTRKGLVGSIKVSGYLLISHRSEHAIRGEGGS